MNPLAKAYYVLRYLGPGFAARRLMLAANKRLGVTRRRYHPRPWESILLADIVTPGTPAIAEGYSKYKSDHLPPFLFPFGRPPAIPDYITNAGGERTPSLRERLDLLRRDRCIYFFNEPSPEVIDWYHNPFDDTRGDSRRVWCDIPDFLPEQGDPRVLWEPSRTAWAFDLARAQPYGLDRPCNEVYWRWVDSWMDACPPFDGFQWKCGQESTVRLIAILFAFGALPLDEQDAPRRWLQMARLAWATGHRIIHHIDYAVSQNNNHALSEACGLMLVAHLFPEFRDAEEWDRRGRSVLSEGMKRQIYADGSYIQHSMNYHRVMLQVCTLALRIAELSGRPLERLLYELLGRAARFLFQMSDPQSGQAPKYGNNDGACVLPLSECGFHDHRPAIQSAHYLVHRKRLLGPGPWDEETLWMHGESALHSSVDAGVVASWAFPDGGYYTLRRPTSWLMARAHRYRDRPGQYDALHVDLWWKSVNVLCDRGTYRYYHPTDSTIETAFRSVSAHNAIEVDDRSPEVWLGRFLHVPFSRAEVVQHRLGDGPLVWAAMSDDHSCSPWRLRHARTVISCDDSLWIVVDDLIGEGRHRVTLRWQLPDCPAALRATESAVEIETTAGPVTLRICANGEANLHLSLAVGRRERGRAIGFSAPYYNSLVPAPTLEGVFDAVMPLRVVTCVFLDRRANETGLTMGEAGRVLRLVDGGRTTTLRFEPRRKGKPSVVVQHEPPIA